MERERLHERLRKFALVTGMDILWEKEGEIRECLGGFPDDNPAAGCDKLREKLKAGADGQLVPFIRVDDFGVFFACFHGEGDEYYYVGPLSMAKLSPVDLRSFYMSYEIQPEDVRSLQVRTLQEILCAVELMGEMILGQVWEDEELLEANHIAGKSQDFINRDRTVFLLEEEYRDDTGESPHHTYRQERGVVDAIREGRTEDALNLSHQMDAEVGRLDPGELKHWRSVAIVAITVCTRSAIEGGLSPETAYRISDYYIRKCNSTDSVPRIIHLRDETLRELSSRIQEKKRQRCSSYIETCKTYISRHYREKIYLEDAAAALGISPSYLSRMFKRETGICFQDYVNRIRAERAANLLRYSDMDLSAIAGYVGFPSQSYFGRIFKACRQMTPGEYRDRYKVREWSE